ncbi:hypothetical protein BU16DRAFT_366852 [Lophium mytilinum]|uniref:C6 transcription factor n=1 Tax=Lophium mytilinum TaxID=390894 RepID=A0A6A6QUL7_9PEZI|nr:hypothetical protein BU16DRAFT_366852 [Lophium mytilinum]
MLATTIILCMTEITLPNDGKASWRTHLQGASALIERMHQHGNHPSNSATVLLLARKYQALKVIALACGKTPLDRSFLTVGTGDEQAKIDDLAGYSRDLLPIFQGISALDKTLDTYDPHFVCEEAPGSPHFDYSSPLEHESHLLFDRVRRLLVKRAPPSGFSYSNLAKCIRDDLFLLDEAYHHMAILQIYRQGSLSVPYGIIEGSKQRILACLSSMTYCASLCPGVAALPPLFVAGCLCSDVVDREEVRRLLKVLWINFGMGNVIASKEILERAWKRQDAASNATVLRVSEALQDEYFDVLPY